MGPPVEIGPLFMQYTAERIQFGRRRYGKGLTAHDGRDPLRDAIEEAFDLLMYLLKAYYEKHGCLPPGASG